MIIAGTVAAGIMPAPSAMAGSGDGTCSSSDICVFNDHGHNESKGYHDLGFVNVDFKGAGIQIDSAAWPPAVKQGATRLFLLFHGGPVAIKEFALFLAVDTVLVTDCSSLDSPAQPDGTANPQPEPSVRSIPKVPTDRFQVIRPLDKHTPDRDDDTVLKQAEAVVANRCVRDLGHRQHPLDEQAVAEPEANIYEFLWFPEAQQNGYFLPSERPEKGRTRIDRGSQSAP